MPKMTESRTNLPDAMVEGEDADQQRGKNQTERDISIGEVLQSISKLDLNDYATRKSFAQGMLDLALLTANASQLKYLLTVGEVHEFYHLLLTLVIVSISMQVRSGTRRGSITVIGLTFVKFIFCRYSKR